VVFIGAGVPHHCGLLTPPSIIDRVPSSLTARPQAVFYA